MHTDTTEERLADLLVQLCEREGLGPAEMANAISRAIGETGTACWPSVATPLLREFRLPT